MELEFWLFIVAGFIGWLLYLLGWRGAMLWLLVCGLITLWAKSVNWRGDGGCDGGLCILGYLAGILVWLTGALPPG